jgi:hypothetical protein
MTDEFKLDVTGKAVILIELGQYGPMEFSLNDTKLVLDLLRILVKNPDFTVGAYTDEQKQHYKSLLDIIV